MASEKIRPRSSFIGIRFLALALAVGAAAGLGWLTYTSWLTGNAPHLQLACSGMLALLLWGVAEGLHGLVQVKRSKMQLRKMGKQNWLRAAEELSAKGAPRNWSAAAAVSLLEIKQSTSTSAGTRLDKLPEPLDLLDPIREIARHSALVLKWSSGSAVLIGLLGTLYGLGNAIELVLLAVSQLSTTGDSSQQSLVTLLTNGLSPMKTCFVSSGAGVMTCLALSALKMLYETELDCHFLELEADCQLRIWADFFPEWQPPALRLEAQQAHINTNLLQLLAGANAASDRVNGNIIQASKQMLDAYTATSSAFSTALTSAVTKGMTLGTEAAVLQFRGDEARILETLSRSSQNIVEINQSVQSTLLKNSDHMTALVTSTAAVTESLCERVTRTASAHTQSVLAAITTSFADNRNSIDQSAQAARQALERTFTVCQQAAGAIRDVFKVQIDSAATMQAEIRDYNESATKSAGEMTKSLISLTKAAELFRGFGEGLRGCETATKQSVTEMTVIANRLTLIQQSFAKQARDTGPVAKENANAATSRPEALSMVKSDLTIKEQPVPTVKRTSS